MPLLGSFRGVKVLPFFLLLVLVAAYFPLIFIIVATTAYLTLNLWQSFDIYSSSYKQPHLAAVFEPLRDDGVAQRERLKEISDSPRLLLAPFPHPL